MILEQECIFKRNAYHIRRVGHQHFVAEGSDLTGKKKEKKKKKRDGEEMNIILEGGQFFFLTFATH